MPGGARPEEAGGRATPRAMGGLALLPLLALTGLLSACGGNGAEEPWRSPVPFDTARVVVGEGVDTTSLLVELAESDEQRQYGLSRRPSLDPGSGMLFVFDSLRAPDQGFWMWRTVVPLDIAYVGPDGVISSVVAMAPCADALYADACPNYPATEPYLWALEANQGWFEERGYEETTMRAIARRAGVGLGTITHHFPDKRSLLVAAFQEDLGAVIEERFASVPGGELRGELLHLAEGLYGFYGSNLWGPYYPLNDSGLVLGNPPQVPTQTYAYKALPNPNEPGTVSVIGFNQQIFVNQPLWEVNRFDTSSLFVSTPLIMQLQPLQTLLINFQ